MAHHLFKKIPFLGNPDFAKIGGKWGEGDLIADFAFNIKMLFKQKIKFLLLLR